MLRLIIILVVTCFTLFSQDKPRNIILLIGDGMGIDYVSTSVLSMENDPFKKFNSIGLSITSSLDNLITESAAGATALATGHKTANRHVSVDLQGKPFKTLFEYAKERGYSTGLVVTSTVTHATPGAFVGHVVNRDNQLKIAEQLVNSNTDVVIGSGLKYFLPKNEGGDRDDGKNLINDIKNKKYQIFLSEDELKNVNPDKKFYALLANDELQKADKRKFSLGELTQKALKVLSKNKGGFVLLIEGSQIDWAGHDNIEDNLLDEMKDFNTAVNTALSFSEKDGETLVVVTADHETGGMGIIGGSANRKKLDLKFLSTHHTANMVGVFAKGPAEEQFRGIFENAEIGQKLINLIK